MLWPFDKKILIVLAFIMVLSACNPIPTNNKESLVTVTSIDTPSPGLTPTVKLQQLQANEFGTQPPPTPSSNLTKTPSSATPVAPPTALPVATDTIHTMTSRQLCDDTPLPFGSNSIQSGTLLFHYAGQNESWWATKGSLNEAYAVSNPDYPDFRLTGNFSPNGAFLVVTSRDIPSFTIFAIDGSTQAEHLWLQDWPDPQYSSVQWFDNNLLSLHQENGFMLISPTTGEIVSTFQYPEVPAEFYLSVNKELTRVVYDDQNLHPVIVDLEQDNQILYRSSSLLINHLTASWSPDGTLFVFEGDSGELHLLDRNGNEEQITEFSRFFEDWRIHSTMWSPNSRYILILGETTLQGEVRKIDGLELLVFDLEERTLIEYCSQSYGMSLGFTMFSGDGSQFVISYDEGLSDLILDIATGEVWRLPQEIKVLAWGAEPLE